MIEILKFSKPRCRPCAVLSNYLSEIDFVEQNAELTEIDITQHPEYIDRYNLSSVPVLVFLRNGLEITRFTGLRGTDEIIDAINTAKEAR